MNAIGILCILTSHLYALSIWELLIEELIFANLYNFIVLKN